MLETGGSTTNFLPYWPPIIYSPFARLSRLMVMHEIGPSSSIFPAALMCHTDRLVFGGLSLLSLLPGTLPLASAILLMMEVLAPVLVWGSYDVGI